MADVNLFGGPDINQMQTNNEVAAELNLPVPHPEIMPTQVPERMFAPNPNPVPPELQQVPNALLPNEVAATVPKPEQLMQVPTGATITNFAPKPERAPAQVDKTQYAVPEKVEAPQVPTGDIPTGSGLLSTYDTQQRANKAIANAMAQKSTLDEMAQAELEDKVAQSQLKQQKIQDDFNTEYKSRVADFENISKHLASQDFTTAKVDSGRLWNNLRTGQKILAGLAIALGGYGGALSGKGDNKAMDVINKAIDRDIEEQKFNIQQDAQSKQLKSQSLRDQASMQGTLLSSLRQKYGDDVQAEIAMRTLAIQQTQLKLQQIASRTESKTVLQNAEMLNAQLEREKQTQAQAMQARIASMAALRNLGTADVHNLDPAVEASLPENIQKVIKDRRERSLPGWQGQAPTKEVAGKFLTLVNETQPAIDGASRILALTDPKNPNGASRLSPEDRARISTEMIALVGALRVPFTGPGAMTDSDFERIMSTLGDPNKIVTMPSWQRAKLTTVLQKLDNDLETAAKNSGFRRTQTVDKTKLRPY